jgi:O-methyltransferase
MAVGARAGALGPSADDEGAGSRGAMIGNVRNRLGRLLPAGLRWWLVRRLPGIVSWAGTALQGIRPLWDEDPEFNRVFALVADRCLMDKRRAYVLFSAARAAAARDGAVAEMGVYRGASAKILLEATAYAKEFHGFDTFAGLPDADPTVDGVWRKGDMREADVEDVARFLGADRTRLFRGRFPDSASGIGPEVRYCLVHVDGDLYQTTRDALAFFYPRLVSSGLLVVNDYGFLSSPGVRKAVDEFFAERPEVPIYLPSGQCLVVKS